MEAAPSLTDTDKVRVALWYPAEHPARGCQGRHRHGEGSSAARPDSCRPLRWPRLFPPACRLTGAAATDPRDIALLSGQGPSSQSVCLSVSPEQPHTSLCAKAHLGRPAALPVWFCSQALPPTHPGHLPAGTEALLPAPSTAARGTRCPAESRG